MKHISEVLETYFDKIDRIVSNAEKGAASERQRLMGTPTGFSDLDVLTGGLQQSDLIVVAGPESVGKTSLALGMAYGAAIGHQKTVGIFSLEMSAEQLVQRVLSMETGVDSHRLRLGQIDDGEWDRISRAFGRLSEAPLLVDDSKDQTILTIRAAALQAMAEKRLGLLIVDQLGLIRAPRREKRKEEISEVSRGLKRLARELNVPIVVIARTQDAIGRRVSDKPGLSDLWEYGSIEGEADIVLFVHRNYMHEDDPITRGMAEITVAKHRNGPVGTINLRFFERTARFTDLEIYPGPGM